MGTVFVWSGAVIFAAGCRAGRAARALAMGAGLVAAVAMQ